MSLKQWLLLMLACLVGIAGLFLTAGAGGGALSGLGLLAFAAAVVLAFALVKRYFDDLDAQRH